MSLFPAAQRPKHLVQFNAGKCIREGNLIKPDLRKGVVYMDQSDDQLMHFCWKERKSTEPEEDLIIFPDEAEFIRVNECTTGRVYLMKFKSSNQKLFFWMQSKDADKDEELANRVNLLINDPQAAIIGENAGSSRMPGIDYGAGSPADMMHLLGGSDSISRENILQFLQTAGGFGGTIPMSMAAGGDGPIDQQHDSHDEDNEEPKITTAQLERIRNLLLNTETPDNHEASISITPDFISEVLHPILNDRELASGLFPSLSEDGERTLDQVQQLTSTTEFKRALATLSYAFEEGELRSIIVQLDLDSPVSDIEAFLRAIGEYARQRQRERERDQREAMEED